MHLHERVRSLTQGTPRPGPVVYWMGRDQRVRDNAALVHAQVRAREARVPLVVAFNLVPSFLGATLRQYDFMLTGLEEVAADLEEKNIRFYLLRGDPAKNIPAFVREIGAGALVGDFEPLHIKQGWKRAVTRTITIPFDEVDARNIVPCWVASEKREFGAYTIRNKIHRNLDRFMEALPSIKKHPHRLSHARHRIGWQELREGLDVDASVAPVAWIKPGERAALKRLRAFVRYGLAHYESDRNDPAKDGQSNLSPYLHFGQLSSHAVAREVIASDAPKEAKEAFIEELVVRRELADNFCFYNRHYDVYRGLPDWARTTLDKHKRDARPHRYSLQKLEEAATHDDAWNAAQTEMVVRGKMHGYMRMYWAKKILEWSPSPTAAIRNAIYLNDKYELDGRDPNGYTGIMWAIGGVHDRPWGERPIFGKIRYMNYAGLKRKFDIGAYVERQLKASSSQSNIR